ncbi:heme ABC transporter permease CcmC [Anaplasma bovis]|uniref:heme ABC transporter permease CcmC n=1 Tax=Anaplasma bovis TaxID=186733 RepID=UPI002FF27EE5
MHSFVCSATKSVLRYGFCSCAFFLVVGLYYSLHASPPDYMQGDLVRIMYLHVPSAWISLGTYFLIAVSSFVSLVKRNLVGATFSRAIAPIGACFTLVCLVAGNIWGKHTWGTWWVWDARLTSMLLLLFLYLGYILLWNVFEDQRRAAKTTALFSLFSAVNVPIVKFSVNIWATLHQPSSIIRKGGIAVDSEMLFPLILMFVAFTMLCIVLTMARISTLVAMREVQSRTSSLYGEAL